MAVREWKHGLKHRPPPDETGKALETDGKGPTSDEGERASAPGRDPRRLVPRRGADVGAVAPGGQAVQGPLQVLVEGVPPR